jgi:CHAD domain-containing protein
MSSRSFRFDPGQPVPDEVRRVARGRIDHALDELRGESDSTREEAVHEARKDMKKLRALLRLVRGELGDRVYAAENTCFRDTARERVADWPLETDGFEAFEEGLERIYRQGRRDFRAARKSPSAERMHEWRKRTKDLWYHLQLLEDSWKPVISALADEAHELSDRLGDEHDLTVLREWAHRHASALNGAEPVLRGFDVILENRQRELQQEAFEYGARIYADKPSVFVGRVEGWWEAARSAPSPDRAST